jgi:hypothetical protein
MPGARPDPYGAQAVGGAANRSSAGMPPARGGQAPASSGMQANHAYGAAPGNQPYGTQQPNPYAEPGQRTVDSGYSNQRSVESGYVAPVGYGGGYPGADFGPSGSGTDFGPTGYDFGPTGGDRRAAESGYLAPVARQDTGGRRRRAEGQPTWQDSWQQNGSTSGSHARPDYGYGESPSGSHATGRSVSELLASNGGGAYGEAPDASTPRRRRRRED